MSQAGKWKPVRLMQHCLETVKRSRVDLRGEIRVWEGVVQVWWNSITISHHFTHCTRFSSRPSMRLEASGVGFTTTAKHFPPHARWPASLLSHCNLQRYCTSARCDTFESAGHNRDRPHRFESQNQSFIQPEQPASPMALILGLQSVFLNLHYCR